MATPSWLNPLTWPIEPWVLLGIEITAILYLRGQSLRKTPSPSGGGQGRRVRLWCFWLGLAAIVLALDTPLEWYARVLLWAHMTQHLILIVVAAPLLVVASPWIQIWRGLPLPIRRVVARFVVKHPVMSGPRQLFALIATPVAAWIMSSFNLWLWHWPPLYDLTLRNHAVHHLEHALFLGLGILFWAQVIDQYPFRVRLSPFKRAVYVFTATVQSWALAGLLAFSTGPFYAYAQLPYRPGGISALTDQQYGAGMMWVPGSITYSIVFVVCLYLWFKEEDAKAKAFSPQQLGASQ
jgi:cytochrome c oxidase assembly factor CtaG